MALDLNTEHTYNISIRGEVVPVTVKSLRDCGPALAVHKKNMQPKRGAVSGAIDITGADLILFSACVTNVKNIIGREKEIGERGWAKEIPTPVVYATCRCLTDAEQTEELALEIDDDDSGNLSETTSQD